MTTALKFKVKIFLGKATNFLLLLNLNYGCYGNFHIPMSYIVYLLIDIILFKSDQP